MSDGKRDLENEGWEQLRSHMDTSTEDEHPYSYRRPEEFHLYGLGNDRDEHPYEVSEPYGREEAWEHHHSHDSELYGVVEEDPNGTFYLYGIGRPDPD